MSFTFAIGCRLRRHGFGLPTGRESGPTATLVVTRLEYPHNIISLSLCDPFQLSDAAPPKVRFSLLGAPTRRGPGAARFTFLAEAPADVRLAARFIPATGSLRLRWWSRRPLVSASFDAPLSENLQPSTARLHWTLAGHYAAWTGELLPEAIVP